jgi:pre-mRNA-splicing factor SPF27
MSRRGAVAPLALPPAPSGSVLGGRLDQDCVDSLPYADVLPQGWRDAAEALVREELRRSDATVDDYVAQLAPVPALHFKARHCTHCKPLNTVPLTRPSVRARVKGCPLIGEDLARHTRGEALPPPDAARYQLDPPAGRAAADPASWRAALDSAKAQLEHQGSRIQNLELLLKYGANAWLASNKSLEAAVAGQGRELQGLSTQIDGVNKTRKLQQQAAGSELAVLEGQWRALVAKNAALEATCVELEAQLAGLQGRGANGDAMS